MKQGKYLKFYYESLEAGRMPSGGLCGEFSGDELFNLMKPDYPIGFWGYDSEGFWTIHFPNHNSDSSIIEKSFSPLRQTIVLFCAAMNNEL